jgi:hypothetical protein
MTEAPRDFDRSIPIPLQIPILRTTADEVVDEHGAHQAITLADLETRDEVCGAGAQSHGSALSHLGGRARLTRGNPHALRWWPR